jgi:hypothetical protein
LKFIKKLILKILNYFVMKAQIEKIFQPIKIDFNPDVEQERILGMIPEPFKF